MSVALISVEKGIERALAGYINRDRAMQSFLNRNVVEAYRNIQRKRWMTENESEGKRWEKLNPKYAEYKKKKWAGAPGGGRKMLVASGDLVQSVIGPGAGFKKIATPRQLVISSGVKYAKYVDESRTFTEFSQKSLNDIRKMIAEFLFFNIMRPFTK